MKTSAQMIFCYEDESVNESCLVDLIFVKDNYVAWDDDKDCPIHMNFVGDNQYVFANDGLSYNGILFEDKTKYVLRGNFVFDGYLGKFELIWGKP